MQIQFLNEELLEDALVDAKAYKEQYKTKSDSSYSHLYTAAMDWRVEEQWKKDSAQAKGFYVDDKLAGAYFTTMTQRDPRHVTLRHIVVMEPFRGKGIASVMMSDLFKYINEHPDCNILRLMSDKKSIGFYEKLGFHWLGISKTGLPFTYCYVTSNDVKQSNANFVGALQDNLYNMRHELKTQLKRLAVAHYDIDEIVAQREAQSGLNIFGI